MGKNKSDDIKHKFVGLGNGIKKLTKTITREELIKHEREIQTTKRSNDPVDIIAITENGFKLGYEVYDDNNLPPVSDIIQKINLRRKNRKDITWVAIIPYRPYERTEKYGTALRAENIHTVAWDTCNNTRQINFFPLGAFNPNSQKDYLL